MGRTKIMGRRQALRGPDLMRADFAAYDAAVEKVLGANVSRTLSDTERSAPPAHAKTRASAPTEHAASDLFFRWVGHD